MPLKTGTYGFNLPIRNEGDLKLFVQVAFGISVPDVQVCANHSTPWRALVDAYFARSAASIWEGSRGFAGKSFNLALLASLEWATLSADVNVLGGSGEQARRIIESNERLWAFSRAPRYLIARDLLSTKLLHGGARLQALMASQKSVRGPHPQRLRIDEADEVKLDILDAALGQPMGRRMPSGAWLAPHIVFSSTHHHPDGTMTELKRRMRRHGWSYHPWCFKETMEPHGWLSKREVTEKRDSVPLAMWENEYELQAPNPGGRAILPAKVEAMFRRELGEYDGYDGAEIVVEPPIPNATYAHGCDWARKVDRSVFVTLRTDVKPRRLVAFRAINRIEWPIMEKMFVDRVKAYGGPACHDATGGGDLSDSHIRYEHGNIAQPVILTGRERTDVFTAYITSVEREEVVSPHIRLMYDEHVYCGIDDLFKTGGHPPDTFVAAALASKAAAVPEVAWATA